MRYESSTGAISDKASDDKTKTTIYPAEQVVEEKLTPEMKAKVDALINPEGDRYNNARKMGFYCEQCG